MDSRDPLYGFLRAIPDALASPINQYHQDELNAGLASERMRYEHEERMRLAQLQHEEYMESMELRIESVRLLCSAVEQGGPSAQATQELALMLSTQVDANALPPLA